VQAHGDKCAYEKLSSLSEKESLYISNKLAEKKPHSKQITLWYVHNIISLSASELMHAFYTEIAEFSF